MIKKLERTFALSEKGAKDLVKGFIACAVHNLTLFVPVGILYLLSSDMMINTLRGRGIFYAALCLISVALIMISYRCVYKATYFSTYVESGVRRVSLAEKLRKIPLSYFGKKDLADITSTIMADAATLETGLSHWVPELIGAVISTTIAALSIMFFDWRMGLAALWPIPVAILIVILSRNVQYRLSKRSMDAKMEVADGIQECIETMRDLKSCNAEKQYLNGLFRKIDKVEKRAIISEVGTAVFVVSASFILKIGIGTVALTGSILLTSGEIDVLTLSCTFSSLPAFTILFRAPCRTLQQSFHSGRMSKEWMRYSFILYRKEIMSFRIMDMISPLRMCASVMETERKSCLV